MGSAWTGGGEGQMWTKQHRARHEARLKQVVMSAAVAEIARWLERCDPPRSARRTPLQRVVAALVWHLRVGGSWRALPPSFPAWRTVYGWFRRWLALGLFDVLLREVARRRRRSVGRKPGPSLAIVDTQAVKCIGVRGPRGYDAAKKVLGRKRVGLVDAAGHLLAIAVVPASVQDRDTLTALDVGKECWPSLREAVYDSAFAASRRSLATAGGRRCKATPRAERCREWSNLHSMRHRIEHRDPTAKGFVVIARRWGVERSFSWLTHWGGLLRDRAGRLDVSAARIAFVAAVSGIEALINPVRACGAAS